MVVGDALLIRPYGVLGTKHSGVACFRRSDSGPSPYSLHSSLCRVRNGSDPSAVWPCVSECEPSGVTELSGTLPDLSTVLRDCLLFGFMSLAQGRREYFPVAALVAKSRGICLG